MVKRTRLSRKIISLVVVLVLSMAMLSVMASAATISTDGAIFRRTGSLTGDALGTFAKGDTFNWDTYVVSGFYQGTPGTSTAIYALYGRIVGYVYYTNITGGTFTG